MAVSTAQCGYDTSVPASLPRMTDPLRLGVVGTGLIAGVVADALSETDRVVLAGVASRRPEAAQAFAEGRGARAFATVEALAADPAIDAIYVATPTHVREWACLAAVTRGKHLLAEKPFASAESAGRIGAAARAAGVAFMDATHFTHHARTRQLRRELVERIGHPRSVHTAFFFPTMDVANIRLDPAREPTGAIGDMAWYCMRALVEYVPGAPAITDAHTCVERHPATGAIVRGTGLLRLSDGCTSTWDAGYNTGSAVQELMILGERGTITIDDFVLDWAGGFPVRRPESTPTFVQRSGVSTPDGFERVTVPSPARQVVAMLDAFAALCREPGGAQAQAAAERALRTQAMVDRLMEGA